MNEQNDLGQAKKTKSSLITILAILITALVVGGGTYVWQQSKSKSTQTRLEQQIASLQNQISKKNSEQKTQKNNDSQTKVTDAATILLASENKEQNPAPANDKNLMQEYNIFSLSTEDGTQKQIALIKNNFFVQPFGYSNNKIFFINPAGELASLDPASNKQETIKIDGIIPTEKYLNEKTLDDFIISGNKVIYLKGMCGETGYCALGIYDMSTDKNQILIDNLHKKIDLKFYDVLQIKSYDAAKNTLRISKGGGDAGYGYSDLYDINLADGSMNLIAKSHYCGDKEEYCTDEWKADNAKYKDFFQSPQMACNGLTVKYSYNNVEISGKLQKSIPEHKYVGCMD